MGSIIDVAYNIVSKYKIGIKFDDLYEQIARKFDFDSDQYLENKSDLFNELCQVSIPWWRSHLIHENRATESIWTEPCNPLLRATKSTKRAISA